MGTLCELRSNKCLNQSCVHGRCLKQQGGHACICDLGYTGEFCDEEINECVGVLCKNGATCINQVGHYYCNCSSGFYGKANLKSFFLFTSSRLVTQGGSDLLLKNNFILNSDF